MARVPDPVPGLIFRYGYVWLDDYRRGRIDPAKDRPACIVARIAESGTSLEIAGDLSPDDKRACGLDPEEPSWVVVSEFNADICPNSDLSFVPGTERFEFGRAPPGLMKRIGQKFLEARRLQRQVGVKR